MHRSYSKQTKMPAVVRLMSWELKGEGTEETAQSFRPLRKETRSFRGGPAHGGPLPTADP